MTAKLLYNGEYSWQGFGNNTIGKWQSSCHLQVFKLDSQTPVVIVADRDNSDTSITNCTENIAALICRDFEINPLDGDGLIWFESYPQYEDEKDVSTVSFTVVGNPNPDTHPQFPSCPFLFTSPKWQPLNAESSQLFYILKSAEVSH